MVSALATSSSCPLCKGPLELNGGTLTCAVGHSFLPAELVRERGQAAVRALWSAVRALEEEAAGLRLTASSLGDERATSWAEERERDADEIRKFAERAEALRQHPSGRAWHGAAKT